jgi:hypothetical protein
VGSGWKRKTQAILASLCFFSSYQKCEGVSTALCQVHGHCHVLHPLQQPSHWIPIAWALHCLLPTVQALSCPPDFSQWSVRARASCVDREKSPVDMVSPTTPSTQGLPVLAIQVSSSQEWMLFT